MKKVILLTNLILSLIFISTFVSCNKDDDENDSGVSVNTVSAKWEISDKNSPYVSFEFTKDGNYIVVENVSETNLRSLGTSQKSSSFLKSSSQTMNLRSSNSESNLSPIHAGTYRIEEDRIILSGFGLIEVISITAEEFTFSFTLESTGDTNSFVAVKSAEPISSSNRTEMFCRTWIAERITVNGEDMPEEEGMIILFSRAGTYLILYPPGYEEEAALAEWKWADKEETRIYYSWNNWSENYEYPIVKIKQLDNNNLVLEEIIDDEELLGSDEVLVFTYYLTLKK